MSKKVPCEVYSRVVGYFRPISQWNKGKQAEFKQRKTYRVDKYTDVYQYSKIIQ